MSTEDHASDVLNALDGAISETVPAPRVGVLFSGGLDSSIVASLLSRHCEVVLYTVGVEGSYDLRVGRETAEFMGLEWHGVVVDESTIVDSIPVIVELCGTVNPVIISFEFPLLFVAQAAIEEHLFSGQGADELFAGYARYMEMDDKDRRRSMAHDLRTVLERNLGYEEAIASRFGKTVHHPYLHPLVREAAMAIPPEEDIDGTRVKAILRDVARQMGLGDVVERKKKAAQYGSGIMRAMKAAAKRQGLTVRMLVTQLGGQV